MTAIVVAVVLRTSGAPLSMMALTLVLGSSPLLTLLATTSSRRRAWGIAALAAPQRCRVGGP